MANLSNLSPLTTAASSLSGLILVSPQSTVGYQPQTPATNSVTNTAQPPLKPLLFHYEGQQAIDLESDITDHYVEDNTAVQDQIALRPEVFTVRGFIGELNNVPPLGLQTAKAAADKLLAVGSYTPKLTSAAQLAYNEALFLYQTGVNLANAGVQAWDTVSNLISGGNGQAVIGDDGLVLATTAQNLQQQMFQQLYGYWSKRFLFTVQTPWCVFQNMAIKSLRVIQDDATKEISDFEITFKRIRTADTFSYTSPVVASGRAGAAAAAVTDNGTTAPANTGPSVGEGLGVMGAPPP